MTRHRDNLIAIIGCGMFLTVRASPENPFDDHMLQTISFPKGGMIVWDAIETRRYVWDGYNIAAEIVIDEVTPSTNVTYYTWGLDLSGTLQGAGGVGGLLAVVRNGTPYFPCYDGNGNVTDYVDAAGNIRAHYEYSPFGEIAAQSGDLADTFTHRFSTKPFDAETSLVMYQLRPYAPGLGRWMSQDPIGEKGDLNLHAMCANNCLNQYDSLGLAISWKKNCSCVLSSSDKKTIEEKLAKFSQWIDSVEKNGWKDLPDNFTVKRAKALSEKLRNINVSCRDGSLLCYNNTGWGWPFSSTVNICVKNIKNVYGSTSYVSLVIAHETIHTLGKIGHDKSWIDGDTDDPTQWEWWLYSNVR